MGENMMNYRERQQVVMLKEVEGILLRLEYCGVGCKVIDRTEFIKWFSVEIGEEYAVCEFTRFFSQSLVTLQNSMSGLDLRKIFEYQSDGKVLIFWSDEKCYTDVNNALWYNDDKHRVCSAYYDGAIDATFVGRLCRYAQEIEAVAYLESQRIRFAKVGADFSFAEDVDDCGKTIGTVCTMTGFKELEHTTPCKVNLENQNLLLEWLLERECIERANALLVCYQKASIHYERCEINHSKRPAHILGAQDRYFYAVATGMNRPKTELCHMNLEGIATMEHILAEKIRVGLEEQEPSTAKDVQQEYEAGDSTEKSE